MPALPQRARTDCRVSLLVHLGAHHHSRRSERATSTDNKIQGDVLGNPKVRIRACGSGGALGPAGTAAQVYRADVLRYLPVNSNNIRQVTPGGETVTLPDSGAAETETFSTRMGRAW